jgi:hypothetical protein
MSSVAHHQTGDTTMLNKTLITLAAVFAIGAASPVLADYEFDSSGAPIDMHIVDAQHGAFATRCAPRIGRTPAASQARWNSMAP